MIRSTLAALAAMTAFAGPAIAQDATTAAYFERFDRYCLATGGEPVPALAAADADGWIPMPQSMIDEVVNERAPEAAGRLSGPAETGPAEFMVSASPEIPGHAGVRVRTCGIMPAEIVYDRDELVALVEARLGFASPVGIWAYSGTGPFTDETLLVVGGMEAMAGRAQTSPVYMLNLVEEQGYAGLIMLRVGN